MSGVLTRFRVLPLLVLVALAAFAVRMGDAFLGVRDIAAGALAESYGVSLVQDDEGGDSGFAAIMPSAGVVGAAPDEAELSLPVGSVGVEAGADNAGELDAGALGVAEVALPQSWADPALEGFDDSPGQIRLFEDLAARRAALDARERAILAKEALLAATERQIDEKLGELSDLKGQIEKLLGQQDQQEQERITSLVKIYEGMKARDAAGIFNQMDMDILVQVVSRMSERKSAPIIAAMDKMKANQLTVMLSEMDRLPAARTDFRGIATGAPMPTVAPAGAAELPGLDALGAP